jgi:hypothetical protein
VAVAAAWPKADTIHILVKLRSGRAGSRRRSRSPTASRGWSDPLHHPYYTAVLLEESEIRLPGIFTIAEPRFRLLAKRARRKGIDRELEASYGNPHPLPNKSSSVASILGATAVPSKHAPRSDAGQYEPSRCHDRIRSRFDNQEGA